MNEHTPALKQAFLLRKEKKTTEALAIYEPIWEKDSTAFDEWNGWSFAYCLKEKKRYDQALDVCRTLYPKHRQFENICQLYAWCIYFTQLAGDKQPASKDIFEKAVQAIVTLCGPEKAFSPAVKSIFKWIKYLAEGNQNNWDEIGRWLNSLNKEHLSIDTYTVDVPGRRSIELASELEEWYSWQSKWLLQTGQWENCVRLCDEALSTLRKWHYSNDIWFGRRKAASLVQLGQKSTAFAILAQLIKRKREWFMLADMAELLEDPKKAIEMYAEAALAFGDPPKKMRVYANMASLLAATGEEELAKNHRLLLWALRQENGWPIPADLAQALQTSGGLPPNTPSSSALLQQLKPIWQKLQPQKDRPDAQAQRNQGKIDHLLANGEAGFIKPKEGTKKIYFGFNQYKGSRSDIKLGLEVSYEVRMGMDKKKNVESETAVNIRKKRD